VAVEAIDSATRVARRVLTVPAPRRGWRGRLWLAASDQRIAAVVTFDDDEGNFAEWRLYSGPPAGPLALDRRMRERSRRAWFPFGLDADGDRLLLTEARFMLDRTRATVLAPGAAPERVPRHDAIFTPALLAGDRVAFAERGRVVVADRRTGAVQAAIRLRRREDVEELDLAPDGRLVADADGRLLTAAPGVPRSRLPGAAGHDLTVPRFAGDRVAALERLAAEVTRPVLVGPAGPAVLGTPSAGREQLAADARGAAWIADGCVLYAPLDGPPPTEPPAGPCPRAQVQLEEADQRLRGRRLRIVVTCVAAPPSGCRGTLALHRFSGRPLGHARVRVPAGARRTVDIVLTRSGARRVRRSVRRSGGSLGGALLEVVARVEDGRRRSIGVVVDRVSRGAW
jgi:hypothetical protein